MKYKNEKLYKKNIKKLVSWASKKKCGVRFVYGVEEQMTFIDNGKRIRININTRFKPENQLYALLHECGHLLIHSDKKYEEKYVFAYDLMYKEFDEALNDYLKIKKYKPNKYKGFRVDVVAEELKAWEKGKTLAKRLGIYVNEQNYKNVMVQNVSTYILGSIPF